MRKLLIATMILGCISTYAAQASDSKCGVGFKAEGEKIFVSLTNDLETPGLWETQDVDCLEVAKFYKDVTINGKKVDGVFVRFLN